VASLDGRPEALDFPWIFRSALKPVTSMTLGTYLLQGDIGAAPEPSYTDEDLLSAKMLAPARLTTSPWAI